MTWDEKTKQTGNAIIFTAFFAFIYNWIFKKNIIDPGKMKVGQKKQLMKGDTIKASAGTEYTIYNDDNGVKWIERTK